MIMIIICHVIVFIIRLLGTVPVFLNPTSRVSLKSTGSSLSLLLLPFSKSNQSGMDLCPVCCCLTSFLLFSQKPQLEGKGIKSEFTYVFIFQHLSRFATTTFYRHFMALHLVFCITMLKPNNVFQVFGKSTCSLTSRPFSLPGGNISRWPFLRKIFWEFKTIFFQLTSVLHASCPARLDLQPLLHPALYEHAAEGTRQFASSLLGEIGFLVFVFVRYLHKYL